MYREHLQPELRPGDLRHKTPTAMETHMHQDYEYTPLGRFKGPGAPLRSTGSNQDVDTMGNYTPAAKTSQAFG